jgi:transposase
LRERALLACARGQLSRAKIAALFHVGESTLYRWLETWRGEGRRAAKPHGGGPEPRLDAAALDELKAIVAEANDLSPAEYAAKLQERAGVRASGPTVSRALKELGLVPGVRRAGADPGSTRPAGRDRGNGQSRRAQGRAGPPCPRGGRDQLPPPAVLRIRLAWAALR